MIGFLKNKYTTYKNSGFTLIELIVVMSVVAVLVLLAVPKFLGQTKEATRTKHLANASQVEKAAERYYMAEQDWPRLTDDAYTSEQITDYAEKIYDVTGEEIELNPDGNYYDIDYGALDKYVKVPNDSDKNNYILQNPVGKVYYLENLSREGKMRVDYGVVPEESDNQEEPGYSDEEIEGLIAEGYTPIATAEELNDIRDELDKKYVQVANIDLSEYSEEGWNPIGTRASNFTGTYDGGNYVIRGLEVKGEGKNYQGLFGYVEGANIRNVGLIGNKVTGSGSVGGLVGRANNSTIINSYTTGSVTGAGNNVGGLVGYARESTNISNAYSAGPVTGTGTSNYVGGLVGNAVGGTISNSYATGSVEGSGNVGGLVGVAQNSTNISNSYATGEVTGGSLLGGLVGQASSGTTISNSYATGPAKGSSSVGGLVGWANKSTISNSYATGPVEGISNYVGGLVGRDYKNTSSVTSSYWNIETTGQSTSAGGVGKSTDEMKLKGTYEDWDFETVWKIDEGNDYPRLR